MELAPAFVCAQPPESASKLDALQTLREFGGAELLREAYGVRWQAKRDTALAQATSDVLGSHAAAEILKSAVLRSAGAARV